MYFGAAFDNVVAFVNQNPPTSSIRTR